MKQAYILVERPTDAEFLRRILQPDLLAGCEIVPAGGSSGIPSLARSILVRRKKPVVVVMDADSNAPDVIEERLQSTEELIRAADASIPVKVIVAVPVIEAWFFAALAAIARVCGGPVPIDWLPFARKDPRGVLQQLAAKNNEKWDTKQALGLLDADDIDKIRTIPEVSELNNFLHKLQKDQKAA